MNKRIYKEIVNIVADSSGQLYKVYKDGSYEIVNLKNKKYDTRGNGRNSRSTQATCGREK